MWGVIRSVEGDESPTSQAREVLYFDGRFGRAIGLAIRPTYCPVLQFCGPGFPILALLMPRLWLNWSVDEFFSFLKGSLLCSPNGLGPSGAGPLGHLGGHTFTAGESHRHCNNSERRLIPREIAVSSDYFQQWAIDQMTQGTIIIQAYRPFEPYIQVTSNTNHPINNSNIYHPSIDLLNMKTVPLSWNTNIVRGPKLPTKQHQKYRGKGENEHD